MFPIRHDEKPKNIDAQKQKGDQDWAHRVAHASLDELLSHIDDDCNVIRAHRLEVALEGRNAEASSLAHKTRRYNLGMQRVEDKMQGSLSINLAAPAEMPQCLATLKTNANKLRVGPSQDMPGP